MPVRCQQCGSLLDEPAASATEAGCPKCGYTIKLGTSNTVSWSPREARAVEPAPATNEPARDAEPPAPVDRNAATVVPTSAAAHADSPVAPTAECDRSWPESYDREPPSVLRYFGDYQLLDEIARGGMGVVYRARQTSLNRIVAVKMILGGPAAGEPEVKRFLAEAEAAANLHHPNIVAIHEVGAHDGRHYFSMEFIAGTSLTEVVRDNPLPGLRAATYLHKIAEAIHYSHGQGILHRDLKPSNVLIDEFDEPRVTDFGLAKLLRNESGLTASGAVLGTPSYMPPEQAAGEHDRVGPVSDVYSLGALLYELVTGRAPFRAESPIETMRQVLDVEPAAPRLLNPHVDGDLETICLKCLQKAPERRYASARLLADDLARYLRREPILARPVGNTERFTRWCRRNPWIAGLGAAVFLLLVTVAAGSLVFAVRIAKEQAATDLARLAADAQRVRAESNFASARDAVHQMLTQVAEELLPNLPQTPETEPARERLLQDALRFYQKFLRENADDPAVRRELAQAFHRVAEISRLLGNRTQSQQAYQEAIGLFEKLIRESPEAPEHAQGLATAHNYLGELCRTSARPNEAEAAYRRAIELQEGLVAKHATVPVYQLELARSFYNLGLVLKDASRLEDADLMYDKSRSLLATLRTQFQHNPAYIQELARVHSNRGILFKDTNRAADAELAYRAAIELQSELVAASAVRTEYREELASYHANLGNLLLLDAARRGDAVQPLTAAQTLLVQLTRESPSVPRYRQVMANCCNSLGTLHWLEMQPAEAKRVFERGIELASGLVAEFPAVADYELLVGRLLGNLGSVHVEAGELPQARELLERAVEHQRRAFEANSQNAGYRQSLARNMARLAATMRQLGDHADSARLVQERKPLVDGNYAELVQLAKELAECVALVERGNAPLSEADAAAKQKYAAKAVDLLRDAITAGFDARSLKGDPGFTALRQYAEFQKLIDSPTQKQ